MRHQAEAVAPAAIAFLERLVDALDALASCTAVTAGDHIDWITTSPAAIRFTLSSKVFQSARKWPAFFSSISLAIVVGQLVLGRIALVAIFQHRRPPRSAIMASMMPLVGMFWIAVLPLKSGEIRSAQVVIVAADQVGADAERVGIVDARHEVGEVGLARRQRSLASMASR